MVINQKNSLNRKARRFLLSHCISKRGAEVMFYGFDGYLNGDIVQNATLIRRNGKWEVFSTSETVLSINGEADGFSLTKNSLY